MTTHRAVITFTADDGEEHVAAVTLEVDDITANPWHATIVPGDRRSPRWSPGLAVITIGARAAAARVVVSDDRKDFTLVALGPFGPRSDLQLATATTTGDPDLPAT